MSFYFHKNCTELLVELLVLLHKNLESSRTGTGSLLPVKVVLTGTVPAPSHAVGFCLSAV